MSADTSQAPTANTGSTRADFPDAKRQVIGEAANEFVFGVVGHIGSGTSEVARFFKELLERQKNPFQTKILKATDVIETWSKSAGLQFPALSVRKYPRPQCTMPIVPKCVAHACHAK